MGLHTIPFAISELRVGARDDTAASNDSAISPDRCGPGPSSAMARRYFFSFGVSLSNRTRKKLSSRAAIAVIPRTVTRSEHYLYSEIESATSKIGAQNRKRARAFDTRALVVSDIMGNARKKSDRVSVGLRERTLAAHDAARISSPPRA